MLRMGGWYWYLSGEEAKLERHKCGKWMYFFEDQVAAACEEMGIRAYVGQTIIDMETCDSKNTDQSLAMCEELIRKWKGHARLRPVVAPQATKTNPPEVLKAAYELAERYDVPYTLHVSEMDYELEMFR